MPLLRKQFTLCSYSVPWLAVADPVASGVAGSVVGVAWCAAGELVVGGAAGSVAGVAVDDGEEIGGDARV